MVQRTISGLFVKKADTDICLDGKCAFELERFERL
jgi:hypothetical protein